MPRKQNKKKVQLQRIPNVTRGELIAKGARDLEQGDISVYDFGQLLRLTDQEIKYCELYTSPETMLNGEQAALEAYDIPPTEVMRARAVAKRLGEHQGVCTLISALLTSYGWTEENVHKQHLSLIEQNADKKTKFLAIKLYYELFGKLKNEQPLSVTNNIDITVYNTEEKKAIRDMLYKGMGKDIPKDEDINFEDIKSEPEE